MSFPVTPKPVVPYEPAPLPSAGILTPRPNPLAPALKFGGPDAPDDGSKPPFWKTLLADVQTQVKKVVDDPKKAFRENVENRLLYHPTPGPVSIQDLQSKPLAQKVQDVYFDTPDGTKLHAWYVAPDLTKRPQGETVVFAHGNGGNILHRELLMQAFSDEGFGFFAFDYRGYGNSQGVPSEEGLYQDFETASKFVKLIYKCPVNKQIAVGESLGAAVATHAASQAQKAPYRMLFTYAGFTSLPAVAPTLFKQVPLLDQLAEKFLPSMVQQKFDALSKIAAVKCPVLFAHGDEDNLVPPGMQQELLNAATQAPAKDEIIIEGADHNDLLFNASDMVQEVIAMLAKTEPPTSGQK